MIQQKRERFKQLTQTTKVQTGKAYAADVRRSKIHPTVKKLTAWPKLNRLSQRKASIGGDGRSEGLKRRVADSVIESSTMGMVALL